MAYKPWERTGLELPGPTEPVRPWPLPAFLYGQPTIVRDIPDSARLLREEQFGPVLPVLRYSDIDDVITRVNDTEYGLGGSVWSSDRERAFAVAARMDAGTVWVNQHLDMRPDIPFGGGEAVRRRRRTGLGRARRVHPGDRHQRGEITTHWKG